MTLVLSMNPFTEPEGEPPLTTYPPLWKTERCSKTCLSNTTPPGHTEYRMKQAPFRQLPDNVSISRIAYFKRKFIDDDEASLGFRTYCQNVAPVLEERAYVLRLSLEKMRFIDDPEAFLRRSVLVNNLLRRLRTDILLQSTEWCFSPNPVFTSTLPPTSNNTQQAHNRSTSTPTCFTHPAGPPFRKRFRMVRSGHGGLRNDCAQTCCCIYAAAAAAGHYLHLPFSVYDADLSTPHLSSIYQIASHRKLELTMIEGHNDEDVEEEEEEEIDDEEEEAVPSTDWDRNTSGQKNKMRTTQGHAHTRTEEERCVTTGVQEQDEDSEQEDEANSIRPRKRDSVVDTDLQKFHCWHRRGHRQGQFASSTGVVE
nr:SERTA domain-containing protein 4-like [Nerophis lumbriciformis]